MSEEVFPHGMHAKRSALKASIAQGEHQYMQKRCELERVEDELRRKKRELRHLNGIISLWKAIRRFQADDKSYTVVHNILTNYTYVHDNTSPNTFWVEPDGNVIFFRNYEKYDGPYTCPEWVREAILEIVKNNR